MYCGRSTMDTALGVDAAEQGNGKKFMEFDNKLCVQNVHSIVRQMLLDMEMEAQMHFCIIAILMLIFLSAIIVIMTFVGGWFVFEK